MGRGRGKLFSIFLALIMLLTSPQILAERVYYGQAPYCGNGICDGDEACSRCPSDCCPSANCDDIKLSLQDICYDFNRDITRVTLRNDGSSSLLQIRLHIGGGAGGGGLWGVYGGAVDRDWPEDLQNFRDGRTSTFELSRIVGSRQPGLFAREGIIDDIFIVPMGEPGNFCTEQIIQPEKITDCTTGQQVWPTDAATEAESTNMPTTPINDPRESSRPWDKGIGRVSFFIGGISAILLAGLFLVLRKRKKKIESPVQHEMSAEAERAEAPEKPKIPINIREAITVSGFTMKHRDDLILDNVDFVIKRQELTTIVGGSGAGKSTIIEALVGRKTPTKGKIKILEQDFKRVHNLVGFVPQHPELYMNHTALQNIQNSAIKYGVKISKGEAENLLSRLNLAGRKDVPASKLSGGQLKLLSLASELIKDPEILILDEPTSGLDPNSRNEVITILSKLVHQNKKTVVFSTHFMDDAEEADNVLIIGDKKVLGEGSPEKLIKRLPSGGKVLRITLEHVDDKLLTKIQKLEGVHSVISEGRALKIISENPNLHKVVESITSLGGIVTEAKMDRASMMEVFVFYTGKRPEDT